MSVLIIFIKLIAVFDLLVIAVYFGGDILSTMLNKLRRKPKQDDPFDFSLDTVTVSLSIDSIRQLYSGDAADFVEEKILPNAEKTMAVLTEQEQTAARLLLSALIGFLAAEAPMDEQSFPLMMELLNCTQARSSARMGLSSWITRIGCFSEAWSRYSCWLRPDRRTLSRIFFPSAGVTRKAITWFLVRTAMFHHLRIKIWYAAAPFPGTTTYQKFLWIAIPNGRSYQKVINWPRGAEKWVRASARKRRLAAACGKPNALLAPPEGG